MDDRPDTLSTRRPPTRRSRTSARAFTLIEILIVVVILGILAAITVPQFASAGQDAARTTFSSKLRTFVDASMRYELENGDIPEDASSGTLPAGFEDYVHRERWENGTPIGGVWDTERVSVGGVEYAAVGVHFNGEGETRDDAFMNTVDAIIDDGDVNTGAFRVIAAGRYYFVLD